MTRWVRPQSPPGVERVRCCCGLVYERRALDDRWSAMGIVWWTWAQLLSNVEWLEEA